MHVTKGQTMNRHIIIECNYTPGGDVRPPVEVYVAGPGWQKIFVPKLDTVPCSFTVGDIVRVQDTYSSLSWIGARGVVMDINQEGILVEFGTRIDTALSTRRFQHATNALETC